MADAEKMHRTMDYIERHPRKHDQDNWHKCFAGLTLRQQGYTLFHGWTWRPFWRFWRMELVPTAAIRELGLGFNEAEVLFSQHRTVSELRQLVDNIAPVIHL